MNQMIPEEIDHDIEAGETCTQELAVAASAASRIQTPDEQLEDGETIVALAAKIEEYAKAHETVLKCIVQRSHEGDWFRFSGPEGDVYELGAAGAERIAAFIGASWAFDTPLPTRETGRDRYGQWVRFTQTGKVSWRGRTIPVVSTVSSRQKFYGFARGEWKDVSDVSEHDMQRACMRAVVKEGIRQLLGLRRLSAERMAAYGYAPMRGHRFRSQKSADIQTQASMNPSSTEPPEPNGKDTLLPIAEAERLADGKCANFFGKIAKIDRKTRGDKTWWVVRFEESARLFSTWREPLQDAHGKTVRAEISRAGDWLRIEQMEVLA